MEPLLQTVLPSGLRICMQRCPRLPKVHVCLYGLTGEAGGAPQPADKLGLTELTTTLLADATHARTEADIALAAESAGGQLRTSTGNNTFGLGLEVLSIHLPTALNLLAQAVLQPAFTEGAFAREQSTQLAEIQEDMEDIGEAATRTLRAKAFGSSALATPPGGTKAGVEAITVDDIKTHWAQLTRAGNCVLSLAGDFDPAAAMAQIEADFAGMAPSSAPNVNSNSGQDNGNEHAHVFTGLSAQPLSQTGVHTLAYPAQQCAVQLAFSSCGLTQPGHLVSDVLDDYLSGMASPLFEAVREKAGLAYSVGARRIIGIRRGLFYLEASTAPQHKHRVLELFEAELNALQTVGITQAALVACTTRLKAAKLMQWQNIAARGTEAALHTLYGLPIGPEAFTDQLESVTTQQVQTYAQGLRMEASLALLTGPQEG